MPFISVVSSRDKIFVVENVFHFCLPCPTWPLLSGGHFKLRHSCLARGLKRPIHQYAVYTHKKKE